MNAMVCNTCQAIKKKKMNTDQKIIWREMETKFPPKFQAFKLCENLVLQWEISCDNSFMGNRRYVFIVKKRQTIWTELFI